MEIKGFRLSLTECENISNARSAVDLAIAGLVETWHI